MVDRLVVPEGTIDDVQRRLEVEAVEVGENDHRRLVKVVELEETLSNQGQS